VVVELCGEARLQRMRLERRLDPAAIVGVPRAAGGLPIDAHDGVEIARA
jgi:hypothetical protein